MEKTSRVIASNEAASTSRVVFTRTEPMSNEASANEIELPDQQNAVARALSSPINGYMPSVPEKMD